MVRVQSFVCVQSDATNVAVDRLIDGHPLIDPVAHIDIYPCDQSGFTGNTAPDIVAVFVEVDD